MNDKYKPRHILAEEKPDCPEHGSRYMKRLFKFKRPTYECHWRTKNFLYCSYRVSL